ncbi:MAG: RNA-binding protein [Planctomycetes bacterium]|nr:RNA-binding protein [Planctomycetota bacterium]
MSTRLYVGNLNYRVDSEALAECFRAHGTVQDAHVVMDRETGQSKGFGFVEMSSAAEAQAAIEALDGKELEGRSMRVNEARPREDRRGGGGGGGGGRRGGGGW